MGVPAMVWMAHWAMTPRRPLVHKEVLGDLEARAVLRVLVNWVDQLEQADLGYRGELLGSTLVAIPMPIIQEIRGFSTIKVKKKRYWRLLRWVFPKIIWKK